MFNRYMRSEAGEFNAIMNAANQPVEFVLKPWGGEKRNVINRMIVSIGDAGSIDSGAYGNGVKLSKGIEFFIANRDGKVDVDLLDGDTVKRNVDWVKNCHDMTLHDFGSGDTLLTARWTFSSSGTPLVITRDRFLVVRFNDNFTKLTEHCFKLQGFAIG